MTPETVSDAGESSSPVSAVAHRAGEVGGETGAVVREVSTVFGSGERRGSETAENVVERVVPAGQAAIEHVLGRADTAGIMENVVTTVLDVAGRAINDGFSSSSPVATGSDSSVGGASNAVNQAVSEVTGGSDSQNVTLHFECEDSDIPWSVDSATFSEGLNIAYGLSLSLRTEEEGAEPSLLLGASCQLTVERGSTIRYVAGLIDSVHEGSPDS